MEKSWNFQKNDECHGKSHGILIRDASFGVSISQFFLPHFGHSVSFQLTEQFNFFVFNHKIRYDYKVSYFSNRIICFLSVLQHYMAEPRKRDIFELSWKFNFDHIMKLSCKSA